MDGWHTRKISLALAVISSAASVAAVLVARILQQAKKGVSQRLLTFPP
jgi:hypothetical protein